MQKANVAMIKVKDIIPTADNARVINEKSQKFTELLNSIKEAGVQIPVHVRPHPEKKGKYDLRAGEKRWRCCVAAKIAEIPAIVHEGMSDEQAYELTFIENFAREDLSAIEEAAAVEKLLARYNRDVEAVAAKVGHSVKWVRLRANIDRNISQSWRDEFENEESKFYKHWSIGHLCVIARLPEETQERLYKKATNNYTFDETATIPELESYIADMLREVKKAPWAKSDFLLGSNNTGYCSDCMKRSSAQPGLWADMGETDKDDKCLDSVCWEKKKAHYLKSRVEALKEKHADLLLVETNSGTWRDVEKAEEVLGAGVLRSHNYDTAKKSDPDARPAVIVTGAGAGKLTWIKRTDSPARRGGADNRKGKKSLTDKRKELDRKRWAYILDKLISYIRDCGWEKGLGYIPDKALQISCIIANFGTGGYNRDKNKFGTTVNCCEKLGGCDAEYLLAKLWDMATYTMIEELSCGWPVTQTPDDYIERAKSAMTMLGVDHDQMWNEACGKHPEPKSWAKQSEIVAAAKKAKPAKKKATKKAKPVTSVTAKEIEALECTFCGNKAKSKKGLGFTATAENTWLCLACGLEFNTICQRCKAAHPGCDDCCSDCQDPCNAAQVCGRED